MKLPLRHCPDCNGWYWFTDAWLHEKQKITAKALTQLPGAPTHE